MPYLDEGNLYKRFKLDEPWDSPNNRPLLSQMPTVFHSPWGGRPRGNKSGYKLITGPGTMFQDGKQARLRDITDGTSNTAAVLEVHVPLEAEWTKPGTDFKYTGPNTHVAGSLHWNGIFLFGLADGSVRGIHHQDTTGAIKQILTQSGGEVIDWNEIRAR